MIKLRINNISKALVVIVLSYFFQIYPYIHFHHSCELDHLQVEISFHPIDVEADHLPEHHGHDDQHQTDNDQSNWYLGRTNAQRIANQFVSVALPFILQNEEELNNYKPLNTSNEPTVVQRFNFSQTDPRGPPIVS